MLAWVVVTISILVLFWFVHLTYSASALLATERDITLSNHEEKPYEGKHRDPHKKRRKRKEPADPQVYDYGIENAARAIEEEERENGKR